MIKIADVKVMRNGNVDDDDNGNIFGEVWLRKNLFIILVSLIVVSQSLSQ